MSADVKSNDIATQLLHIAELCGVSTRHVSIPASDAYPGELTEKNRKELRKSAIQTLLLSDPENLRIHPSEIEAIGGERKFFALYIHKCLTLALNPGTDLNAEWKRAYRRARIADLLFVFVGLPAIIVLTSFSVQISMYGMEAVAPTKSELSRTIVTTWVNAVIMQYVFSFIIPSRPKWQSPLRLFSWRVGNQHCLDRGAEIWVSHFGGTAEEYNALSKL